MSEVNKWFFVAFLASIIMLCNGIFSIGYEKNDLLSPSISNKYALSYELSGDDWENPEIWVDKWFFDQPAPFKYRLLGKIPIFITYKLLSHFNVSRLDAFYYTYLAWTFVFMSCFLFYSEKLFSIFMSNCNLSSFVDKRIAFYIATSSLALSPPVLFAFKFPVHGGPNDFLAYSLISFSLLSLVKSNIYGFMSCAVVGIFCRETNLVTLIPFVFMGNISLTKKWSVVGLVGLVFLCYRLGWEGSYNPLYGALHNFEYKFESVLFLFMTFGPFWVLGWLGHREVLALPSTKNNFIQAVNKSYYISTAIVTVIVFSFARVREMRIEFILFFYYIPYGLLYCITNWNAWKNVFNSYKFVFALFFVASIVLAGAVFMPTNPANYISGLEVWKSIFLFYLAISLTVLTFVFLTKPAFSHAQSKG